MVEKIVYDWLTAGGITAYMEMPDPFPGGSFVLVEKTGSTPQPVGLEAATLALQSYSPTLYGAASLNLQVKNRMAELYWQPTICRLSCNSDYNYTDTQTKRPRYQAVYDVLCYEQTE